jgi:hypothetical protein
MYKDLGGLAGRVDNDINFGHNGLELPRNYLGKMLVQQLNAYVPTLEEMSGLEL